MGGDFGPSVTVPAVIDFLISHPDAAVYLYGREDDIRKRLGSRGGSFYQQVSDRLQIVHCEQSISADAVPSKVLRGKSRRESSMWKALQALSVGEVQACVSAGETGNLMAMSIKNLGTLPGIARPAICSPLPTRKGRSYILDLGANVDCSVIQLHQFATMATIMLKTMAGWEPSERGAVDLVDKQSTANICVKTGLPSVALLNVGIEDRKGNRVVREVADLLRSDQNINYVGFIEADSLYSGDVDIVVCDGFVGNVVLKTTEGVARLLIDFIRSESSGYGLARLQGLLVRPLMKRVLGFLDPCHYNGASLLGLRGTVVKSHGAADQTGFARALDIAFGEARNDVCKRLNECLS